MTPVLPAPTQLFAHRGFSSRQPEMTLAAYQEAIAWSLAEGVPLGLECDVQLTADRELVCLHDARLGRTAAAVGAVSSWTLAELRELDFGSWCLPDPAPEQRALVTLGELLDLVHRARQQGAEVSLAIETKHHRRSSLGIDERVCDLLTSSGCDQPDAPVRLITFSVPGVQLLARRLPALPRTLLVEKELGCYGDGVLPDGISVVGVDIALLRREPGFVARARSHGNEVHSWTVNRPADLELCRDLGVTGVTTNWPDRALAVWGAAEAGEPTRVLGRTSRGVAA